jgi:2-oxoisovalerate dehydrogenase E1 component alpha subunit
MSFVVPSAHPAIPTYRVMDSDGVIVDKSRGAPDVEGEEVVRWYKNMLSGTSTVARSAASFIAKTWG